MFVSKLIWRLFVSKLIWKHMKKQRHYFADKGPSSQRYGFSSSHVWMWELEHKASWAPKNWCFWTVVLKKTLESPLDCKEIKPVNHKGDHLWIFIGRTEAEAPILWPPDEKNWLLRKDLDAGKDWRQEGTTKDEISWMASLTRWTWVWISSRSCDGQGSLVCCSPRGHKESDMTKQLNWIEPNWFTPILCNLIKQYVKQLYMCMTRKSCFHKS